jgi:hypothetical protein
MHALFARFRASQHIGITIGFFALVGVLLLGVLIYGVSFSSRDEAVAPIAGDAGGGPSVYYPLDVVADLSAVY